LLVTNESAVALEVHLGAADHSCPTLFLPLVQSVVLMLHWY